MTGDCRVFKFFRASVDEKQLLGFQGEVPFSNSSGVKRTEPENGHEKLEIEGRNKRFKNMQVS